MHRRSGIRGLIAFTVCGLFTNAQEVRIGVLGLFHSSSVNVSAADGTALIAQVGGRSFAIESSTSCRIATIKAAGNRIFVDCGLVSASGPEARFASRELAPASFTIELPGKIIRRYYGTLKVISHSGILQPVVTMDLETAVGSVVAAESLPDTPLEALKAQAIAARSYLLAGKGRHLDFDFCDTTHCQFLRDPPSAGAPAGHAARATRGLVLAYHDGVFAAMYTRSCRGRTHTPSEVGMHSSAYPYFSVECKYCHRHPVRWHTSVSEENSRSVHAFDEIARLESVRRLGWDTIPSNDFTMSAQGNVVMLEGVGQGHGIGLCEAGARAMAATGSDFRDILAHYYPGTTIATVPRKSPRERAALVAAPHNPSE